MGRPSIHFRRIWSVDPLIVVRTVPEISASKGFRTAEFAVRIMSKPLIAEEFAISTATLNWTWPPGV